MGVLARLSHFLAPTHPPSKDNHGPPTHTTPLGSNELNVFNIMFAQYNDQNSQNMSVNRALRSFDLTQKEIEDAHLPVKWYSNGGGSVSPL